MPDLQHRFVETNGIRVHLVEVGAGPLVVLLHGFPESWYSWRHQLTALAEAGFHVVAPDQRGYGQTDRPEAIDAYSMFHLVGDVIDRVASLGARAAYVKQALRDKLIDHKHYIHTYGQDMPEIREWSWGMKNKKRGSPRPRAA